MALLSVASRTAFSSFSTPFGFFTNAMLQKSKQTPCFIIQIISKQTELLWAFSLSINPRTLIYI
jgi:hypothetical protein